ncbi:MAG: GT4 family glycosyltransferase PelF [Eubacterium sp.]|nr:GT4 family glycosyltransferase PelF [Eubacterium sp.]
MRICLVLEGSYPYIYGGVSSWTDGLIKSMPQHEFVLLTLGPTKKKRGKFVYKLPDNVVEVQEHFFDEPLDLKPSRSYHFSFTKEERAEVIKMLECREPDWDILLEAFRRQKHKPVSFLMSAEFIDMLSEIMDHTFTRAPYTSTFYMMRSMFLPVLYLMGIEPPKADLYHAICTGYAGLMAVTAAHVEKKPICLTEHGIYSREREEELIRTDWTTADFKEQWINFYYMLSSAIYKKAACVSALFRDASRIQQELGTPKERCRVISNGIDYDRFGSVPPVEPGEIIEIGAAVRFAKIKDIKTMIYAFYQVHQELPNTRLHILGPDEDPDYAVECRELIKELDLSDSIITPGRVNDMPGYYGKLDFTILTSLSEGQPLTILEAFAAGRPCVTTDVGCCRDLIYGTPDDPYGQAGYIARPMEPLDIADKMVKLAKSRKDIRTFGENGRKRVSAYYRKLGMTGKYETMYKDALNFWKDRSKEH